MSQPTHPVLTSSRRFASPVRAHLRLLLLTVCSIGVLCVAPALPGCGDLQLDDAQQAPMFTATNGENSPILCTDGIDNDRDGFVDCNDPDCLDKGYPADALCEQRPCPGRAVCLTTEDSDLLCADGLDNDGNGFVDCKDHGCSRSQTVTVCCAASAAKEDTAEMCGDGLDNDCNGFGDCGDWSCLPFCCELTGPENTPETCVDGIDNDCNGYVDCRDFGCTGNPEVTVCTQPPEVDEDTEETCSDGLDNDRDGHIDCGDWDCEPANGASPFAYCQQKTPEDTQAACSDGLDNDRNGLVDCQNWSCWEAFSELCAS